MIEKYVSLSQMENFGDCLVWKILRHLILTSGGQTTWFYYLSKNTDKLLQVKYYWLCQNITEVKISKY